tara:strand:+ start:4705 stop:5505 length:801 start_codon:yes stop_codon:yes gene_type:complete
MANIQDKKRMSISSSSLDIELNNKKILNDISIEINEGEVLTVIGPNGAGKSTLLKALAGDVKPKNGNILYDEKNILEISIQERAFTRSVMSQLQPVAFDFSVKEIIEMGWINRGESSYADEFQDAVMQVVKNCRVEELLERNFNTLSGGEQRRIHFARTLLQLWRPSNSHDPKYLMLDEPTANLDLSYEIKLLSIVRNAARENTGVMLVLHDLNLAAKFSDKIAVLKNGKLLDIGKPESVLNSKFLSDVYDIEVNVQENPLFISYY